MAAQFERHERPDAETSVDEDAAALAALAHSVRSSRPIEAAEQPSLLERAARGDRASEERLVAAHLPMVIRLAGARMDSAIENEAASVRDAQLLVAAATDYERTQFLMRHELQRSPTEAELAEKL